MYLRLLILYNPIFFMSKKRQNVNINFYNFIIFRVIEGGNLKFLYAKIYIILLQLFRDPITLPRRVTFRQLTGTQMCLHLSALSSEWLSKGDKSQPPKEPLSFDLLIIWRTAGVMGEGSPCFDWVMSKQADLLGLNISLSFSFSFFLPRSRIRAHPPQSVLLPFYSRLSRRGETGAITTRSRSVQDVIAVTRSSSSRILTIQRLFFSIKCIRIME